jgi:hypothetical protein
MGGLGGCVVGGGGGGGLVYWVRGGICMICERGTVTRPL